MRTLHDLAQPVLHALAPRDAAVAVGRLRNVAVGMALVALLLPEHPSLGTGAPWRRLALASAFAALALLAHVVRRRAAARRTSALAAIAAGAVVLLLGQGAAWGLWFAGIVGLGLAASAAAERRLPPPPLPAEPDPLPRSRGGVPRLLHVVGSSLLVVLLVREFVLTTTQTPTESMQPTIMGDRPHSPGDRMVVDRRAYLARDPARWEVAVFDYPLYRPLYFVKRIVGLPGERLEFRDGDIWIDERIARKPPLVQDALWQEVFPRPGLGAGEKPIAGSWAPERLGTHETVKLAKAGLRVTPQGEPAWARLVRRLDRPDLRLSARVRPESGARVLLRIVTRGNEVVLELPGGLDVEGERAVALPAAAPADAEISLSVAEGLVRAVVDGREVARAEVSVAGPRRHEVAVGAAAGGVVFEGLRVEQDLWYESRGTSRYEVPPGHYFMVGDNVAHSDDSRSWSATRIDLRGGGGPYFAQPELPTGAGARVRNLRREPSGLVFLDTDGIERRVPQADVERLVEGVPRPFVPRENLVGRALLIYWPIVPAEAGFRPKFLP